MRPVRLSVLMLSVVFACGTPRPETDMRLEEVALDDAGSEQPAPVPVPAKLSETGLFTGRLRDLIPATDVHRYEVNAPLFSDYAHKQRLIRLPEGGVATYHDSDLMELPEGTTLVKTFYYPTDLRKPTGQRRILETRLLVRHQEKWEAFTYVWDEQQEEAVLELAGDQRTVEWQDLSGNTRSVNYLVPNRNQCKNCHMRSQDMMPIGWTARQLNRDADGENQLVRFARLGLISGLPAGGWPKLADYDDEGETTERRARAWLESNCAHCHRPDGPAKTSGLHLLADVAEPLHLGIGKAPVAAGKGSGGLRFDIVPGEPGQSILVHRIRSSDPGVMMPELGRTLMHREGVELVEEWIRGMRKSP